MAGPSANISRSFFDLADKYAFLITQQGEPSFDANLNYNFELQWQNRMLMMGEVLGEDFRIGGTEEDEGLTISEHTVSTSNNFEIGVLKAYLTSRRGSTFLGGVEFMPDESIASPIGYADDENFIFSGTVSVITETVLTDTSKTFLTSHALIRAMIRMTSGGASGQEFDITANGTNSVTAGGDLMVTAGVVAGDTYLIVPQDLTTPGAVPATRLDDVVLMLFAIDLDEIEDPDLKDPATSLTECHAFQQRWCIRVDEGQAGDFTSDPTNGVGFIRIARFARLALDANITDAIITNDPDSKKVPPLGEYTRQQVKKRSTSFFPYGRPQYTSGGVHASWDDNFVSSFFWLDNNAVANQGWIGYAPLHEDFLITDVFCLVAGLAGSLAGTLSFIHGNRGDY